MASVPRKQVLKTFICLVLRFCTNFQAFANRNINGKIFLEYFWMKKTKYKKIWLSQEISYTSSFRRVFEILFISFFKKKKLNWGFTLLENFMHFQEDLAYFYSFTDDELNA